jgi:hypothetical protein
MVRERRPDRGGPLREETLGGEPMPTQYRVKPGDHLTAIADRLGLEDTQTLLSQPGNSALADRKHPEMLDPDETLAIPDLKPMTFTLATGQRHKLTVKCPKAKLCVGLVTFVGQPSSAGEAEVTLQGRSPETKSLDGGKLDMPIPPACGQATIKLASSDEHKPDVAWNLQLGHLPRIESDEGLLERLRNLGYYRAVADTLDERERRSAIEEFQHDQGLTLTGQLDEDTKAKIEEVYGC